MNNEFLKMIELIKKISKIKSELSILTDENIENTSKLKELFSQLCTDFSNIYEDYDEYKELNNQICNTIKNMSFPIEKSRMSEWIDIYLRVIAIKFLAYIRSEKNLDIETTETIISFYENSSIDSNIKAMVYFLMSQTLLKKDARRSYDYGMKAFELNPDVLKNFNIEKHIDVNNLQNEYSDVCPICKSVNVSPYININQFLVIDERKCFSPFKIWIKCNDCENLFAYNFPVMEMGNINGHYTKKDDDFIQPVRSLNVYSDIFNKCNQLTNGNKYLEIGVGNGEMLATALEFGYDVKGIEICKSDCEKISSVLNIEIICSDFLKADIKEKFDIIVMGDVLEHISKPADALIKAREILNDDGVLWISTPNYESGFSRLMNEHDPMWNQLNHFTYFSYKGLKRILAKLGMNVVHYDVSNRYNGSMELYVKKQD